MHDVFFFVCISNILRPDEAEKGGETEEEQSRFDESSLFMAFSLSALPMHQTRKSKEDGWNREEVDSILKTMRERK